MKRKSKKGIVTSRRGSKWKRAWNGFKHLAVNLLAAAGFVWLLMLLAQALGGG